MPNMSILKFTLQQLFENKNPKSYIRLIKSRADIFNQVKEYQNLIKSKSLMETVWCIINNQQPLVCDCGNFRLFNTYNLGYRSYCGQHCLARRDQHAKKIKKVWEDPNKLENMIQKRRATCLKKYGVENPALSKKIKEKIKATNLKRYGTEFPLQSERIRDKIKQIIKEKYGVQYPFESEEIRNRSNETFKVNNPTVPDKMFLARQGYIKKYGTNPYAQPNTQDKIKKTLIEIYGVDHPSKSSEIVEKKQATLLRKYGKLNPAQLHINKEIFNIFQDKTQLIHLLETYSISEITQKYSITRSLLINYHNKYGLNLIKQRARSGYEEELAQILDNLNIFYIRNYTQICAPQQLDFYIPEHNLAIEFNGLYWHSEKSGNKHKNYHFQKMSICRKANIQLLTIFEDEWVLRPTVIINKIKHLCKLTSSVVGARKVIVSESTNNQLITNFLESYHVQGKTSGTSISLIGKVNDKTVAVLTLRLIKNKTYEMTRYCIDTNSSYPGLFSKFLSYIRNNLNYKVNTIVTFADLRWSYGDVYVKSGFTKISEIPPDYRYTDYKTRMHKFNFRKHRIKNTFGIDIDGKTESTLIAELGFDKIWDCGKIKYKIDL